MVANWQDCLRQSISVKTFRPISLDRTVIWKYKGLQVWYNKATKKSIRNSANLFGYNKAVIVYLKQKKKWKIFLDTAQKTSNFALSLVPSVTEWGLFFPHILKFRQHARTYDFVSRHDSAAKSSLIFSFWKNNTWKGTANFFFFFFLGCCILRQLVLVNFKS